LLKPQKIDMENENRENCTQKNHFRQMTQLKDFFCIDENVPIYQHTRDNIVQAHLQKVTHFLRFSVLSTLIREGLGSRCDTLSEIQCAEFHLGFSALSVLERLQINCRSLSSTHSSKEVRSVQLLLFVLSLFFKEITGMWNWNSWHWNQYANNRSYAYADTANFQQAQEQARRKVVIVGGGFGGGATAAMLQNQCEVTLVDPRPWFENQNALHRAVTVGPSFFDKVRLSHQSYLPQVNIIQGKTTHIDLQKKQVSVDTKEDPLNYDYLVIASGATYSASKNIDIDEKAPVAFLDDSLSVEKILPQVEKSKHIAVIGGGAAGYELAAEISGQLPDKRVVLFHSRKVLLNDLSSNPEVSSLAYKTLASRRNVDLVLGTRVKSVDSHGKVHTQDGKEMDADVVFVCSGLKPNSKFVPHQLLNPAGYVPVDGSLRAIGAKNGDVFALGDVASINGRLDSSDAGSSQKLASSALKQASTVAQNILGNRSYFHPSFRSVCLVLGNGNGMVIGSSSPTVGMMPYWIKCRATYTTDFMKRFSNMKKTQYPGHPPSGTNSWRSQQG
jgi:NADH dehydrogenase